ncbi:periplasmic binding protein-like I [Rhizoclosmatium globosum]|uniref:Periplasmic binding protein-like I n=1 Tax=Rhizoclosmatium globosum TaxID=329046 RepID=A0A1Y2CHV3_9FUNG|nr:periplasmic binding protein-like I [Rhizoclosmatium globosum]|eukprot:ORY46582.1 periplasmic binding protein-like I [Rhizoclosmatium globosum]
MTDLSDTTTLRSYFFWGQAAAEIAISLINNSPHILPNTTINIKRFNTMPINWRPLRPYYHSNSYGGGETIATALEIAKNHPDVVAVVGEFFSESTVFSAEVYGYNKIPLCGATQTSSILLDKTRYPYFTQTVPLTVQFEVFSSLLLFWNVNRVALISPRSLSGSNLCLAIAESLKRHKIEIVASIQSDASVDEIGKSLLRANARYIVICEGADTTADIYLGWEKTAVGRDFVWLSVNLPEPNGNIEAKYGKNFTQNAKGMVVFYTNTTTTSPMNLLFNQLVGQLVEEYGVGDYNTINNIVATTIAMPMFDCVGNLVTGMDKLLKSDATFTPHLLSSRFIQYLLNYTLFQNTGYQGIFVDPFMLTANGDVQIRDAEYGSPTSRLWKD